MCKNLISFDFKVQTMFCSALLMFEYFFVEGATLLEIKKSFRDVDNVLYDWTDSPSSDYCAWRGIACDNVTFNVVALWVTMSLDIVYRLLHLVPCQWKNKSVCIFHLPSFLLQQSFRVESWWWNFTCNRETSQFGLYVIITLLQPIFDTVM